MEKADYEQQRISSLIMLLWGQYYNPSCVPGAQRPGHGEGVWWGHHGRGEASLGETRGNENTRSEEGLPAKRSLHCAHTPHFTDLHEPCWHTGTQESRDEAPGLASPEEVPHLCYTGLGSGAAPGPVSICQGPSSWRPSIAGGASHGSLS